VVVQVEEVAERVEHERLEPARGLVSWLGSARVYDSVEADKSTSVTMSRKWTPRSSFSAIPIWRKSSGEYAPAAGVRCGPSNEWSSTRTPSAVVSTSSTDSAAAATRRRNRSESRPSTSIVITPTT
jgi:hypothetical protein